MRVHDTRADSHGQADTRRTDDDDDDSTTEASAAVATRPLRSAAVHMQSCCHAAQCRAQHTRAPRCALPVNRAPEAVPRTHTPPPLLQNDVVSTSSLSAPHTRTQYTVITRDGAQCRDPDKQQNPTMCPLDGEITVQLLRFCESLACLAIFRDWYGRLQRQL
jgi:hypothetical protein